MLTLHENPDYPTKPHKGRTNNRTSLENTSDLLAAFDHCYWPEPLYELNNQVQFINVDSRVLLLTESQISRSDKIPDLSGRRRIYIGRDGR
jgi:hypothetical protein